MHIRTYVRTTNLNEERNVSIELQWHAHHRIYVIEQVRSLSLLHFHPMSKDSRHNHLRNEFPVPPMHRGAQDNNNIF